MSHKDAIKAYHKNWDRKNYEQHKEKILERNGQRKKEVAGWYRKYKSTLFCIECGMSHLAALQFHHRDRTKKSFSIADVVRRGYGIKRIEDEIEKCDILCVNCHAKVHWRENHETDIWEELLLENKKAGEEI